jgi:hypothetical protein
MQQTVSSALRQSPKSSKNVLPINSPTRMSLDTDGDDTATASSMLLVLPLLLAAATAAAAAAAVLLSALRPPRLNERVSG